MSKKWVHGQWYTSVDILRCIYTEYSVREWTPVMVSCVAPCRPAFWKWRKYCPGQDVPSSYQAMDTETSAPDGHRLFLPAHRLLCLLDTIYFRFSKKDLDGKLTNRHVDYVATCFCKVFDWRKVFLIRIDLELFIT